MAADGSIIIDTRIDTKGFSTGATNLKSQFSGLASSAKKLGTVLAAAFSVQAVVQFAKESIELGSNLQEVQNVVDVTFTTMNQQVNEFAQNAIQTAGLSETMAKKFVGTFGAMAKSFKFSEAEAYSMSTALTQLAGDVASFYNVTPDEAYTKLKSVFTGETESLKDIGVVMTQTALDAYALENGIGKTTAQMSEQEKVALRYRYILDRLSVASGDFVRTSDSWANQTRILSLQFDQLKATIGQGLINALTPVIKVINTIISGLQIAANAFRQFTAILFGNANAASSAGGSIASGFESAAESADNLANSTEAAGKAAKKSLASFDEIYKLGEEASGSGSASAGISGVGIGDLGTIPIIGTVEDNISPQIENLAKKIKELIEPLKKIDFKPLRKSLDKLKSSFKKLGDSIGDALEWAWEEILVPLADWTIEEAVPELIDALAEAFDLLARVFDDLAPVANDVWEDFLEPLAEWTGDAIIWGLESIASSFGKMTTNIKSDSEDAADSISEDFNNAGQETETEFINPTAEKMRTLADDIKEGFSSAGTWISEKFTAAKEAVVKAWDAVSRWFSTNVTQPIKNFFSDVGSWISEKFNNAVSAVKQAWQSVSNWFEEKVANPISQIFSGIQSTIRGAVNGIIGFLNRMISGIVNAINNVISALNKLSVTVPSWVPTYGGRKFGFNISKVSAPQIPYLAKGAVIPPNAPFMAMLGDQKNGTNIEAPLSTIEEALRNVLSEGGWEFSVNINFMGDLAQLARYLKPAIDVENTRRGTSLAKVVTVND